MGTRKFQASRLFTGRELTKQQVLITDENGIVLDLVPASEAGQGIEPLEGILSPGFINCHCHLELSHMRGLIPEHTGLTEFLFRVVSQRQFDKEEIAAAIVQAEEEMIRNGIVAVGDICNTVDTIAQKAAGRLYYHNFIEAIGFNPAIAAQRFAHSKMLYEQFRTMLADTGLPGGCSIVPHAPYSVADELWQLIIDYSENKILSIHNQETAAENEWFRSKTGDMDNFYKRMNIDTGFFQPTGKTSLASYSHRFGNDQSVIFVHNVHTSADDIAIANDTGHRNNFFCFCPNANRYISNQLPDIPMLMDQHILPVIGTDSLASNHQLSILAELKTIQQHYPSIGPDLLLQWATVNGAKALQVEKQYGSFEKGKQPGILLLSDDLTAVKRIL